MSRLHVLILPLLLCGCMTGVTAEKPRIAALDQRLTAPCDELYPIRKGRPSRKEIIRGWGHDRIGLRDCRNRHGETVRIIQARDAALSGAP